MKTIVLFAALLCVGSILYGLSLMDTSKELGDSYIGFGISFLFLVVMPVFIAVASKGKKLKDYMLNEENILKMRTKKDKKTEES